MSSMQQLRPLVVEQVANENARAVAQVYPELAQWRNVLKALNISDARLAHLAAQARLRKVSLLQVMRDHPAIGEERLYEAMARVCNVVYRPRPSPGDLLFSDETAARLLRRNPRTLFSPLRHENLRYHYALPFDVLERDDNFALLCAMSPEEKARFCLVAPTRLRRALMARAGDLMVRRATYDMALQMPQASARAVLTNWQAALFAVCLCFMPVLYMAGPALLGAGLHLLLSAAFFACVVLRLCAATEAHAPALVPRPDAYRAQDMPVYTVLVALHREAEVVPQLLVALGKIVWPRDRLEIKLVCEERDHETIAAIEAQPLRCSVELIKVPFFGPQTKPKALAFALQASSGDFVVLYDAEDRPHPYQLMEAWERFSAAPASLACLQAPLEIANRHEGILPRMFWFEYSALFRGLLPWLARRSLIVPLGGTSNHFRRDALEKAGGWDPFNVTEDADLGVRLARQGYRCGVLTAPTLEDAPTTFSVWLPQRSRWMKGWMQTWLVHMRDPLRLCRQTGLLSFILVQIIFAGVILSAMFHPLLVVSVATTIAVFLLNDPSSAYPAAMLWDIALLIMGYASFLLLGHRTLAGKERHGFFKVTAMTPIYWCMLAVAGWRALFQLMRRPHHWEKTRHAPSRALVPLARTSLRAGE